MTAINSAFNWAANALTSLPQTIQTRWSGQVAEEETNGADWLQTTCRGLPGRVDVYRSTGDIYPAQNSTQAAFNTVKVVLAARYFFAVNVLCDVASGLSAAWKRGREEKESGSFVKATVTDVVSSPRARQFFTNVVAFSYAPGLPFLMPGFMEWFSLPTWFDPNIPIVGLRPSTVVGILRWSALAYLLWNPHETQVKLNNFENWYHSKEIAPIETTEFKKLSAMKMAEAIHAGTMPLSQWFGLRQLGNVADFPISSSTMVNKKRE